jgi:hypothetical protein
MKVRVFSPRRQPIVVDGVNASDSVAAIRTRVRQMLNVAGQNDVLLLHGQVVGPFHELLHLLILSPGSSVEGR